MVDTDFKPWRSSYTRKARCGMCVFFTGMNHLDCAMGKKLRYPLIAKEHRCEYYSYLERYEPSKPHRDANQGNLPECIECAHFLEEMCTGVRWYPFKIDPKCEFFRSSELICKNAVPMLQYENKLRNNYCKLPPHLRHKNNNDWKCMCPSAHEANAVYYSCYKPKGSEQK